MLIQLKKTALIVFFGTDVPAQPWEVNPNTNVISNPQKRYVITPCQNPVTTVRENKGLCIYTDQFSYFQTLPSEVMSAIYPTSALKHRADDADAVVRTAQEQIDAIEQQRSALLDVQNKNCSAEALGCTKGAPDCNDTVNTCNLERQAAFVKLQHEGLTKQKAEGETEEKNAQTELLKAQTLGTGEVSATFPVTFSIDSSKPSVTVMVHYYSKGTDVRLSDQPINVGLTKDAISLGLESTLAPYEDTNVTPTLLTNASRRLDQYEGKVAAHQLQLDTKTAKACKASLPKNQREIFVRLEAQQQKSAGSGVALRDKGDEGGSDHAQREADQGDDH